MTELPKPLRPAKDWDEAVSNGHSPRAALDAAWSKPKPKLIPVEPRPKLEPLKWSDMSEWDKKRAPPREWAIPDRAPQRQVGLFSGEGGTGKSILELMKNAAHSLGRDWLGSMPTIGPTFYLGAEDEEDEIWRRCEAIREHYKFTFAELINGGFRILPLLGEDATLCSVPSKSGRVETTDLYKRLYQAAGDIKPINISVDTLSRAFTGSEIDRSQVYGFAMHMQALAKVANGTVTVMSHPSVAGLASGSGISGSTAWHGAFRFRMYLKSTKDDGGEQPDSDLRELEFKKNQYGPKGESIVLRYERGLFLPVHGATDIERAAREQTADDAFMRLLRRFEGEGRTVNDKNGKSFAPYVFAQEKEAQERRFSSKELEKAMRRLFEAKRIRLETFGKPSQPRCGFRRSRPGIPT